MSYDKPKFPPRENMAAEPLDPRELQEIKWAELYLEQFAHGTSGNLSYSVIAKLSAALKTAQAALDMIHTIINRNPDGDQGNLGTEIEDVLNMTTAAAPQQAAPVKPDRPHIVCLCGSTRFSQTYQDANLTETLSGDIVLTIGCDMRKDAALFAHLEAFQRSAIKDSLDKLHIAKIDLADSIFVLNPESYMGDSTRREVGYAIRKGKAIRFIDPPSLEDRRGLWGWCKVVGREHEWADHYLSGDHNPMRRVVCSHCGKFYDYGGWSPIKPQESAR